MKPCILCQKDTNKTITILGKHLCLKCQKEIDIFMNQTRETDYSAKILTDIRQNHGGICFSIAGSYYQSAGWPDSFIACSKYQGFLEFKGRTTVLRKLQAYTIKQLRDRGVNCYVVRFVEFKPNLWDVTDETGKVLSSIVSHTLSEGVSKLLDVLANLTSKMPKSSGA